MQVLIAPDKFKGSLTAWEVSEAIKAGIEYAHPEYDIQILPVADGGDGSLDILRRLLTVEVVEMETVDALGRPNRSIYLINNDVAYIEVAEATGIASLAPEDRNPLLTSTIGTGQQIRHAIDRGARSINLFLGGSSTNDAGLGILYGLGLRLYDSDGQDILPTGGNLQRVARIDSSNLLLPDTVYFSVYCDVENPMFGPSGAAQVYGPQKGATTSVMLSQLEKGLQNISKLFALHKTTFDPMTPGYGAAGAIASGIDTYYNAVIRGGFQFISEATGLEQAIINSDVVISGEGKLDDQTKNGKVIGNLSKLCLKHNKPLYVICGHSTLNHSELKALGISRAKTITSITTDTDRAFTQAGRLVKGLAEGLLS